MSENLYFKRDMLRNEIEALRLYKELVKHRYEIGNQLAILNRDTTCMDTADVRKGLYHGLLNIELFHIWKDTFFVTNRMVAEKLSHSTLDNENLLALRERQRKDIFKEPYQYETFVVWIEALIPSKKGDILKFTDPFGSVYSTPLPSDYTNKKNLHVGDIAVVTLGFNHVQKGNCIVDAITPLEYRISNA